ncbi:MULTISPECIES: hypothetical protein [unclassified Brevundimonas]|uniref:hypothetical protein n=1 Tax=unclassified Brevundimonas TaxID=2622653 RepID=UPI0025BD72B2|nr:MULTISPECIES: hypothetical protein [unclassified Brevundimonas]
MTMSIAAHEGKPASRLLVVIGFLCTTAVGGLVTLGVGMCSADYQATRQDRTAQVNQFVEASKAFDPLVVSFVQEVSKGDLTSPTREKIKANLVEQRNTLESAYSLLDDREKAMADVYVEALVDADDGLRKATGPLDSRDFAQAAVHVAEIRPDLYEALRK